MMSTLKPHYSNVKKGLESVVGTSSEGYSSMEVLRAHVLPEYEHFVGQCQRLTGSFLGQRPMDGGGPPTRTVFEDRTATAPLLGGSGGASGVDPWDLDELALGGKQYVALGDGEGGATPAAG